MSFYSLLSWHNGDGYLFANPSKVDYKYQINITKGVREVELIIMKNDSDPLVAKYSAIDVAFDVAQKHFNAI